VEIYRQQNLHRSLITGSRVFCPHIPLTLYCQTTHCNEKAVKTWIWHFRSSHIISLNLLSVRSQILVVPASWREHNHSKCCYAIGSSQTGDSLSGRLYIPTRSLALLTSQVQDIPITQYNHCICPSPRSTNQKNHGRCMPFGALHTTPVSHAVSIVFAAKARS
jgi:hypothetical protein